MLYLGMCGTASGTERLPLCWNPVTISAYAGQSTLRVSHRKVWIYLLHHLGQASLDINEV